MNINILEKMNKVPGGLIIIPLLAAILINTFAPEVLGIGGPTTALFKVGSSAMMGIFLLICGIYMAMHITFLIMTVFAMHIIFFITNAVHIFHYSSH